MIEGWHSEDYLVLFDEAETARVTERYGVGRHLPGFAVVGLRFWDDFILRDQNDQLFTVPTVPLDPEQLAPFTFPADPSSLRPDERFKQKIRWYVKPLAFGGDPTSKENTAWISFEEHVQAVNWWNKLYDDLKGKKV